MNENDLERRFRSVTDGPQPYAPSSLRRYLHDLPESGPVRPSLRQRLVHAVAGPAPLRRAGGIVAIACAVAIAAIGTNLAMGIRNNNPARPSPVITATPAPTIPEFTAGGVHWRGLTDYGGAVPTSAVRAASAYLGVGDGKLLASPDGLHWSAVAETPMAADGTDLKSIAKGPAGYVAAGGGDVSGGVEARIYFSPDGSRWERVALSQPLIHGAAHLVVAGKLGFLVAAWNDANDGLAAFIWQSSDGRNWQLTVAAVRTQVWALAKEDTYLLSGTPVSDAHGDYLFYYWNGISWADEMISDPKKDSMEPVFSGATLPKAGTALLTVVKNDPMPVLLTWDASMNAWTRVDAVQSNGQDLPALSSLAAVGDLAVAAPTGGNSRLYVSRDFVTWTQVQSSETIEPTGTNVIQVGDEVLVTGDSGIWLGR